MTTPSTPEPNESISDDELDEITGAGHAAEVTHARRLSSELATDE